jgi:hypothetical protein
MQVLDYLGANTVMCTQLIQLLQALAVTLPDQLLLTMSGSTRAAAKQVKPASSPSAEK